MKRVINSEAQEGRLNLNWLAIALLTMMFAVSRGSEGIGQEPQQADPNAPQRKILQGYRAGIDPLTGAVKVRPVYEDDKKKPVKYRVLKDASGELVKDEAGNFVFVPVYEDEPNEVPPVAQPTTPPAALPEVGRRDVGALPIALQRRAWDIGPEVYLFKYEEPGLMEEEGVFYGVRLGYTSRDWVPTSREASASDGGAMFRAEGRFAFGQVDYDGALLDGTPLTVDGIDDFAFEGRLLSGPDWLSGELLNTLYMGIGYRYLNDDSSFDPAGYERESNYLYVPLGYQFDSSHKTGWSFGFGAEFDLFILGNQRSHLSDFDVDCQQDSGYGYRASVKLQHKGERAIFTIEPFFRYWDIDQSDIDDTYGIFVEPANETTEVGLQLFWVF